MSSYLRQWGIVPVVFDGVCDRYFDYLVRPMAALDMESCAFVYSPIRRNVAITATILVFNGEIDSDAIFYPDGVSFPHGYFVGNKFVETVRLWKLRGVYFRSWVDGKPPVFVR